MSTRDNRTRWALGSTRTIVALLGLALLAGGLGLAYALGAFSEQMIGSLIAIAFVAMLVFLVARVALGTASSGLRNALGLMTLGMAAVALYPASVALHLGHPVATATLGDLETSLALPSGGSYRVLVSGRLHEGHDARIAYRLNAGGESVDGALERQYMTRRARRGAAIQVPEEHDVEAHDVTVSGAPPALVLESVSGKAQLQIQAYRVLPPGLAWAVMAAVLLAAAFLDAKVAANGVVASAAAAAVCFGLSIKTGNPVSTPIRRARLADALGGGSRRGRRRPRRLRSRRHGAQGLRGPSRWKQGEGAAIPGEPGLRQEHGVDALTSMGFKRRIVGKQALVARHACSRVADRRTQR